MNWERIVAQLPFPVEVSLPFAPRGPGARRALWVALGLGAVAEGLFAVWGHYGWYGAVPRTVFLAIGFVIGLVAASGLEWARQNPGRSRVVSVAGPLLAATLVVLCFGTVTALGLTYAWDQMNALVVEDWKLVDVVASYDPIAARTVLESDNLYAVEIPEALSGGLMRLKAVEGQADLALRVPLAAGEPLDGRLLTRSPWVACPANQPPTPDAGEAENPARIDAP